MKKMPRPGKKHAAPLEQPFLPPGPDHLLQPKRHPEVGINEESEHRPQKSKQPQPKPKARRRRQQQFSDAPPQGHNAQQSSEHHRLTEANLSQFEGLPMKDPDYRDQPALTARIVQEQKEEIEENRRAAENELHIWDAKWMHLRYQSTFLDVGMSDPLRDLSPRATSDPGSEGPKSSSSNFAVEHEYVHKLSERMRLPTGDLDPTVMRDDLVAFSNSRCSNSIKSCSSDTTDPAHVHEVVGARHLLRRPQPNFDKPGQGGETITKQKLREHIQQTSEEIVEEVQMHRLNMALTAIEEIPEQVEEVLQRNATKLADNVQAELDVMRDNMRELHVAEDSAKVAQAEIAVNAIEAIPDIIQNSFEARMETAKELVRTRVEEVAKSAQELDVNSSDASRKEIVQQIRCIPAEVKEIADQTVADAVMESKQQARAQFKVAMEALASQAPPRPEETLIEHTREQIVDTEWAPKLKPVLHAANAAVEQVVAIMQGTEEVKEQVTNQVVADTLLQAKVEKMAPSCVKSMAEAVRPTNVEVHLNPGSIGHPELCPRPCLYFMEGKCANGSTCDFCHLSHPKRPAHLDKRHREMIRDMPYTQCLGLVLPILKEKLQAMSFGDHEMLMLQELAKVPADDDFLDVASAWSDDARAKNARSLLVALKAMSIRSLLMTLHRAGQMQGVDIAPDRANAVEAMIRHLRFRGSPPPSRMEN